MVPELPPLRTLPQLFRAVLSEPRPNALRERVNGAWTATSSTRILERAEVIACAIRDAGLEHGDRVALIAHNCVDWIVCDFATLSSGCVVVPIYPTQALDLTDYILQHSGAKLLFIDTQASLDRIRAYGKPVPRAIVFESDGEDSLAAFEARGAQIRKERPDLPQAYEAILNPDDLAVLIYTSGTTGNPKGVMLSHDNLGFDAQSSLDYGMESLTAGSEVLSVLPFSHIYEHTIFLIYLIMKANLNICHDANELLADIGEVRPEGMTMVPRIFDRVIAGINGKAMKAGGLQAKLVPWSLRIGRHYMRAKTFEKGPSRLLDLQYAIAKSLVINKVRKTLGLDRVKFIMSGSAALHIDVAMTFLSLDVPIMQGYGLTETSPVITVNCLSKNKYGTVGRPINGVDVKIADDGEILSRGRNVMHGYFNDPAATAAVFTENWFHTGDIGELTSDGFLRITDRKKEVFKTSTGKFVSPARVEAAIKRSIFVAQAMVVGDGRAYPAALVCPNFDLVRVELDLPKDASNEDLAKRKDVFDFMAAEVRKRTADLGSYEQIRKIALIVREFSVEGGELSPAMKIKRRVVEERYRSLIDQAYA
jgi:long-chain acyl-CoA synthetase